MRTRDMDIIIQSTIPIITIIIFWSWRTESRISKVEKTLKHMCQEVAKCRRPLDENSQ